MYENFTWLSVHLQNQSWNPGPRISRLVVFAEDLRALNPQELGVKFRICVVKKSVANLWLSSHGEIPEQDSQPCQVED